MVVISFDGRDTLFAAVTRDRTSFDRTVPVFSRPFPAVISFLIKFCRLIPNSSYQAMTGSGRWAVGGGKGGRSIINIERGSLKLAFLNKGNRIKSRTTRLAPFPLLINTIRARNYFCVINNGNCVAGRNMSPSCPGIYVYRGEEGGRKKRNGGRRKAREHMSSGTVGRIHWVGSRCERRLSSEYLLFCLIKMALDGRGD